MNYQTRKILFQLSPLLDLCDIINPNPSVLSLYVSDTDPESTLPPLITGFHILDVATDKFLCNQKEKKKSVYLNIYLASILSKLSLSFYDAGFYK